LEEIKFVIEGTLPGLNEYINSCRSGYRQGARLKRQADEDLIWILKSQCRKTLEGCYDMDFVWYEKDKRRDHDNIASARKFILDAMVKAQILPDDGWKYVGNFTDKFEVDKNRPRIEIVMVRKGSK